MFDKYIDDKKDEIINNIIELINIPSVSEENNSTQFPFGENCTKALELFLKLGESLGFKAQNVDNYCGYLEFGEGEELVGIIGHLDVVPADINDGWNNSPFDAKIIGNKLFGRGSIDDKGPVIAALYAMKAIMDLAKINKRVRLIVGLNEEKSWKCINYYKTHEEWPKIGFSPDANFPGIYAEKGILSLEVSKEFKSNDFDILEISTNNNAINVVPKYIKVIIKLKNKIILKEEENLSITKLDDNTYKLEFFGIASHAAHPELGKNAIEKMVNYFSNYLSCNYFKELLDLDFFNINSPKFLNEIIQDESGLLTSNVAICEYNDNVITFKINLRVPVTYKLDDIINKYKLLENKLDVTIKQIGLQEPLYVETNNYLVETLVDIFNEKTGLNSKPIAIGGGTYARAFDNFISYGLTFPGDMDMCHQVNEYVEIDKLITGAKIYAEAIYKLSK